MENQCEFLSKTLISLYGIREMRDRGRTLLFYLQGFHRNRDATYHIKLSLSKKGEPHS